MYRRPLQSAVRNLLNLTATRAAYGKVLDQEACCVRACQLARVSPPCLKPCRTLHTTTQVTRRTRSHNRRLISATQMWGLSAAGWRGRLNHLCQ
ncbi:hypothetical protein PFLUV_G00051490 [Perca fluviatilis]|uniref:Uncharacterized protein n=1 Tax=Perca fluviatilis TaxID=8168 RepID=A0A6A5FQ04_PERFL|nr:hypothetical protein PFLUV_G00051490 [Perca fluviatilis]